MINIFKRSEGSATPSSQSEFRRAVLLLTAYYTLGVFLVLIVFNLMVYGLFANSLRLEEHENRERSALIENEDFGELRIQRIQNDLSNILLGSDATILVLALIVGYVLSRRTLAPLEEAYKKQNRFVADAAHELRTPLAVMKAGSETILRNNRTTDEYVKFIKEYLEEVERLTALSNDLLFLAHNDIKKIRSIARISISEICERQIEIMRAYASGKKISINSKIDPGVSIMGNKDDLIRMIVNLLKNSIDYNKQGGSVFVSLKRKGDQNILLIEDTGIGIKKEDLSHIFERFYKASDSRTQNSSGAGLGLAIVKEIVNEHNGLIKVSSTPEKGSAFEIILRSA